MPTLAHFIWLNLFIPHFLKELLTPPFKYEVLFNWRYKKEVNQN